MRTISPVTMHVGTCICAVALAAWPGAPVGAQQQGAAAAHVIRAARAEQPIVIDGRLDDPAWAAAEVATDFVQREPTPGASASERTEARVLYDGSAVYVGMRMYDSRPDSIRAQLVRRDDGLAATDWAGVFLDSYDDRRTAFHFAVTPRGSRMDMLHYDDTSADFNWDAVWQVATTIDSIGWTAEFRIPLSQLRYSTQGTGRWGIQFSREIARRAEVSYWRPIMPQEAGFVSRFGRLAGMDELRPAARLEVAPYSLARARREPGSATDPFWRPTQALGSAGADVKYGLTSNLTLTATLNPDFGQVEADPSVVNLSSFETFYPERRPFFTEGSEIFAFPLAPEGQAFYSRRIGRSPQRGASVPPGGHASHPDAARIAAAAKISGKTSDGWSVGALAAVTEKAWARLSDSLGVRSAEPVEPRTTHAMARLVRDFRRGESGIGTVGTAVVRDLSDAALDTLRRAAYAGGANWWHRWNEGRFEITGFMLGTHMQGSTAAMIATQRNGVHLFQRTDAAHLGVDSAATALSGWVGDAFLRKVSGDWTWYAGGGARSPASDVNDLGFLSFVDVHYGTAGFGYREFTPGRYVRNWSTSFDAVLARTFGGDVARRSAGAEVSATFVNFWTASAGVSRWTHVHWPWELRGGPALRLPARTEFSARAGSNRRRSTAAELSIGGEYREEYDGLSIGISPTVTTRPSSRASFVVGPSVGWLREPAQYVRTSRVDGVPRYVMGQLEQGTAALTLRGTWLFAPDLSLELYAQPFLSAGRYSRFKEVASARARRFEDRFHTYGADEISFDPVAQRYDVHRPADGSVEFSFGNPDFSVRELNATSVLRWEYRPGSVLFLVWSHARDDGFLHDGLRIRRDLDRLFAVRPTNVFLVKASYWLSR